MDLDDFREYDNAHPEIWESFSRHAFELIAMGRKHYGAKAIMEVIRFHTAVRGGDDFKINNIYTAYYARKFAAAHPKYRDFFQYRKVNLRV
jgi:hypothetical protein